MSRPSDYVAVESEVSAALRIAVRVALLGVTVAGTVILIAAADSPRQDYLAGIAAKHRRLDSLSSPKLIVVGGSNVAFGIDSRALQEELGSPVVNMGLAAGIGLPFMLMEIEDRVGRGDLVLLSPEYGQFTTTEGAGMAKYVAMAYLPDRWLITHVGIADYLQQLIISRVGRAQHVTREILLATIGARRGADPVYTSAAFNEMGDMEGHLLLGSRLNTMSWDARPRPRQRLSLPVVRRLEQFVAGVRARGATVVFAHPAIFAMEFRRDSVTILAIDSMLRSRPVAAGMVMLTSPSQLTFAVDEMYDNYYHLNAAGRHRRTAIIVAQLRAAGIVRRINNNAAPRPLGRE